jgi:DNA-binding CsgD family transcriptional regulator
MSIQPSYEFQWQNVALRKTIYPFREKKLIDFLLIYKEIDLWKTMKTAPVDPSLAAELKQEHTRLQNQLAQARTNREQSLKGLDLLKQKHRAALSSKPVRDLTYKKMTAQSRLNGLEAAMNTVKRRLDWYTQFAPDHPYHDKFSREYEVAKLAYNQALGELKILEAAYSKELAPFESEAKSLNDRFNAAEAQIRQANEEIARLPLLDSTGEVSPRAAVRWLIFKEGRQLNQYDHDKLLTLVLDRFEAEPQRFPKWLQYMVIHFSGMRYQSAHASWAEARDLLESLKIEETKEKLRTAAKTDLDRDIAIAMADLQKQRQETTDSRAINQIDRQIAALKNPITAQRCLLDLQTARVSAEVCNLPDQNVLIRLKSMQSQFPDWVWREIVSRTELRLEVKDMNWETQLASDSQERWKADNARWRSILAAWENKDVTAWRAKHAATLGLIVTRAVCNEIAEHIQHLRGLIPGGGLTAKPEWYLRNQSSQPGKAYFKRPQTTTDLKEGASILFLGWVTAQPNAWQIAKPLTAVDILPASSREKSVNRRGIAKGKGDTWNYRVEGGTYIRTAQPYVTQTVTQPGGRVITKEVRGPEIKEWLRWTHEATIVEVADMADGTFVVTFETGQIGIILRPLGQIINKWDVCVGYMPPNPVPPPALASMLDLKRILLLKPALQAKPQPAVSFGLAVEEAPAVEPWSLQDIINHWQALTQRQKQAVALYCQGSSTGQIAERLGVATSTVRSHLSRAFHKFGLDSRKDLFAVLADWDFSRLAGK